jgi:hypothetical protein
MHVMNNVKFINAKQETHIHQYKDLTSIIVYLGLEVQIRPYSNIYMEWLRKTMDKMGCSGRLNFQVASANILIS